MKWILTAVVLFCVLSGLTLSVQGGPPENGDPTAGSEFVGAKACKKCHMKQTRAWKKTMHSKAWEQLPEKYRDAAAKDEKGRQCISCHVTGHGDPRGGFKDATESVHLTGVQCESCHGPGSKHIAAGQALLKEKRAKFNDGEQSYIVLKTTKCSDCHNPHVSYKAQYAEK